MVADGWSYSTARLYVRALEAGFYAAISGESGQPWAWTLRHRSRTGALVQGTHRSLLGARKALLASAAVYHRLAAELLRSADGDHGVAQRIALLQARQKPQLSDHYRIAALLLRYVE